MLALVSLAAASGATEGVASDVKYIKCATCNEFVNALHASVHKSATEKKAAPSEEEIQHTVERTCNPSTTDGEWMMRIDLVETEDARLELVQQSDLGPCGKECQTVASACRAVSSAVEEQLTESLYAEAASASTRLKNAKTKVAPSAPDSAALRAATCKAFCKKPPPKLEASRPGGAPFRPFTEEEQAEREGSKPMSPGVLSTSALRTRLGVSTAADEAAVAAGARDGRGGGLIHADELGGLGLSGGGGDGNRMGAWNPVHGEAADHDEATAAAGEALGRGESSANLALSAAFEAL